MKAQVVTIAQAGASSPIVINTNVTPINIAFVAKVSGGASLTYKLQYTYDDPSNITTWYDDANIVSETTTQEGSLALPFTAVRLNLTAYTSGNVQFTLVQAGI